MIQKRKGVWRTWTTLSVLAVRWPRVYGVERCSQLNLASNSHWIPVQDKLLEGLTHNLVLGLFRFSISLLKRCCNHPIRPNMNPMCRFLSIPIFLRCDGWHRIRDVGTGSLIVIRDDPSAAYRWIVPSEAPASHHPWTRTTLGPLWQVSLFDTNTYDRLVSRRLPSRPLTHFLFPVFIISYFWCLLRDFFSSRGADFFLHTLLSLFIHC